MGKVVLQALGVGIFIYIICALSQSVKYYVKCSFFVLGAMFSAAVLPIPSLLVYPVRDPRIGLVPALGTRFVMWLMGLTYEVRRQQHINREKGGVIVINHQSGIDLAVIATIWPLIERGTTVVKKFILYTIVKLDKECEAIKVRSNKIVIFPEGTRSQEDELLPFKKGPFHIAIQSQSMIQPIVVSKYHFLSDKRKLFRKGHTIITVLPEISCQGLTKDDLPQLLEKTRNLMQITFTGIYTDWANFYLERAKSKKKVADLSADCRDGLLLAEVIEAVTTFKVPDLVKKPKNQQQMIGGKIIDE